MASPIREKQANRRIRLLLVLFVLVFAGDVRARGLAAGRRRRRTSRSLARSQHEETQTIPAGRGTIFDRTGVQLAIGEQTTTIYADPQQVRERARRSRSRRTTLLGVNANVALPGAASNKKSQFVYVAALRRSGEGGSSS